MIRENLHIIQDNITKAALASGRQPEAIKLVAVSKRKPVTLIAEAIASGQMVFGENYLQESSEKIPQLGDKISWHFIGNLQSNKAKQAVMLFDVIETVDRLKIALKLDKFAAELQKEMTVLMQVNVSREEQKSGVFVEDAGSLLHAIREQTNLRVTGLMTMPPYGIDPEESRPYFRKLRQLANELSREQLFYDNANVALSMGMSGDYQVAIEEGATMVRVGTALFGRRI